MLEDWSGEERGSGSTQYVTSFWNWNLSAGSKSGSKEVTECCALFLLSPPSPLVLLSALYSVVQIF